MKARGIFGIGLAAALAAIVAAAVADPVLGRLRDIAFDAWARAMPRAYDPEVPVRVVAIDEAALARFGQWPWPRPALALLTDRLFAAGAAAVGFDVLFAEPDRTAPAAVAATLAAFGLNAAPPPAGAADHDALFAGSLAQGASVLAQAGAADGAAPVVAAGIAFTGLRPPARLLHFDAATVPLPMLAGAAAGVGLISIAAARDGVVRQVPMVADAGGVPVASMALELLRVAQGAGGHVLRTTEASGEGSGGRIDAVAVRTGGFTVPLTAEGQLVLHLSGPQAARMIPVAAVFDAPPGDPALAEAVAGRIVLVGATATGLFDLRATALEPAAPGVTLHAEALEQILSGRFLARPDWARGLEALLALLAGAAVALAVARGQGLLGAAALAAAATVAFGGSAAAFARAGLLLDPVLPALAALAAFVPATVAAVIARERDRAAVRRRFDRFAPPAVIAGILADPDAALTPQGATRVLTVIFVDMRGFTTVSERMAPDAVVRLVNAWLAAVADALVDHGATIDKFMGDAVMAFWNAPIEAPDHAARALAALAALGGVEARLNRQLATAGLPAVGLGAGVNTGPCAVGLMGSRDRLSYTCVGDTVTLAARLEGLTRVYGCANCVGPETAAALPAGLTAVVLDRVAVKGRAAAVDVACVLPADLRGLAPVAAALAALRAGFLARDWDGAAACAAALAALPAPRWPVEGGSVALDPARIAAHYAARIADLLEAPPPEGWDGTAVAAAKR